MVVSSISYLLQNFANAMSGHRMQLPECKAQLEASTSLYSVIYPVVPQVGLISINITGQPLAPSGGPSPPQAFAPRDPVAHRT